MQTTSENPSPNHRPCAGADAGLPPAHHQEGHGGEAGRAQVPLRRGGAVPGADAVSRWRRRAGGCRCGTLGETLGTLDRESWERWVPADGKGLEVSDRWALLAAARVTLVHFADARTIHCICGTASMQVAGRRGRPPALCSAVNNTLSCLMSICWHAACYLILNNIRMTPVFKHWCSFWFVVTSQAPLRRTSFR